MNNENTLDRLHNAATSNRFLQVFTVVTRVLLAVGFIPPSIPKILHRPFTGLPESNPVGAYFIALYNTGYYYEFIGWSQLLAALLLLVPRTSHIGAFVFLPIIVNIAVLTSSVGFVGTWAVTLLMSFASLWLVAWEYDRIKPVLLRDRGSRARVIPYQFFLLPLVFAAGGVMIGFIWWTIGLGNFSNYLAVGAGLAIGGVVFGLVVATHLRFMPVGRLKQFGDVP